MAKRKTKPIDKANAIPVRLMTEEAYALLRELAKEARRCGTTSERKQEAKTELHESYAGIADVLESLVQPRLPLVFDVIEVERVEPLAEDTDRPQRLRTAVRDMLLVFDAVTRWLKRPPEDDEADTYYVLENVIDVIKWHANKAKSVEFPANHNIDKYTSVGAYPQLLVRKNDVYCAQCANALMQEPGDVVDVNWENPELYCGECEERIESAYAEPERSPES